MKMPDRPTQDFDLIICGAGPAGLSAAAALAHTGLRIALCGRLPAHTPQSPDTRTAALFTPSLEFLDQIGVWTELKPHCAPIRAIRIIDATGWLWRAPETLFAGRDIGHETLGYNCPNVAIVATLVDMIRAQNNVTCLFDHQIVAAECAADTVMITTLDDDAKPTKPLRAPLVVAADGRRSLVRDRAGITTREWSTGQHALTAQLSHSRPHDGVSTEFHRPGGPLTVVPMLGDRSALVWVDTRAAIDELLAYGENIFANTLKGRLNGLLGDIALQTPRRAFALTTQIARRLANRRVVLIGETAHAFPPIGAQGLNLSLRDVATLRAEIENALSAGTRDIGGNDVLAKYEQCRSSDVFARVYGVDLMGRSLTSSFLPATLTRGAILHAANAIPQIRRLLIRQGTDFPASRRQSTGSTDGPTRPHRQ